MAPRARAHGRQMGISVSGRKSAISNLSPTAYNQPHNLSISFRNPPTMDRKDIAKKIREAIFNRIEEDRAIHASSIEQEVEKVLGAMSIGHYPGRGASAPVPETYTLALADIPSHSSGPAAYKASGDTAGKYVYWSSPQDFTLWEPSITVGSCTISPELYQSTLAQVEIIHPEAADK